jgi:ketosteroid isomerase-like protein
LQPGQAKLRRVLIYDASQYSPDALLLPAGHEAISGREAIASFWERGIEAGLRGLEREALEVKRGDGVIVEIGRYVMRFEPEDADPAAARGSYVLVWRLRPDGRWKWHIEIFTTDQEGE